MNGQHNHHHMSTLEKQFEDLNFEESGLEPREDPGQICQIEEELKESELQAQQQLHQPWLELQKSQSFKDENGREKMNISDLFQNKPAYQRRGTVKVTEFNRHFVGYNE